MIKQRENGCADLTTTDYQWMMTGTSFNYSTSEIEKRSESCRLHHWGWLGKSSWFSKFFGFKTGWSCEVLACKRDRSVDA